MTIPLRIKRQARRRRALTILGSSILAASTPWLLGGSFTWTSLLSDVWSNVGNWDNGVPVSDPSTQLIFNGTGSSAYTSTDDLAGAFQLNNLTLNSNATVAETVATNPGNSLNFVSNGATTPVVNDTGSGAFVMATDMTVTNALTFTGTTNAPLSSAVSLNGVISGSGGISFNGGYWQIGNIANSFTGGTTINTGATVELLPTGAAPQSVSFGVAANSLLGGSTTNALVINGGTLKLTTVGAGSLNLGTGATVHPITFGVSGGVLDLTNTNSVLSTAQGGNISAGDLSLTFNNTAGNIAVIKFNGGQLGLSNNSLTSDTWVDGTNALRISALAGTGAVRFELTNGAMLRGGTAATGTATIASPTTIRGVLGGDPTSGPIGKTSSALSRTTGRLNLDISAIDNFTGGLTFEDAVQVVEVNATRAIDGNITIAGSAGGHPGYVTFSGRSTGTLINTALLTPGTNAVGQNVLYLGQGGNDTFTVQDGGTAVFDLRIRTDQPQNNGVLLNAAAVLNAGGTLSLAQSISVSSTFTAPTGAPNPVANSVVGNHLIQGNIIGQGTTAKDAVLNIFLPAPVDLTTPGPLGGVDFTGSNIVVNGSGFGGLRVNALARANNLFAGGAADPVANDTKLNNYLTPARLAALTGSGGYLTPAASGVVWNFPAGGEWANTQPVGLKVVDSNAGGTDVSLAAVTSFAHNVAVDAGATLDTGTSNFTFGPASSTTGLGLLTGNGTVTGNGGITIGPNAAIAPGLGGIGTLTVGTLNLQGALQIDATNTPSSDLLVINGDLTLNATTSSLVLAGTLPTSNFTIATYTGARTGTFAAFSSPNTINYSVDYSTPGLIRVDYVPSVNTLTWAGTNAGGGHNWSVGGGNWLNGSTPATYVDPSVVIFDDTAVNKNVIITGGNVSPGAITVTTNSAYSIAGSAGNAIGGAGGLVLNGSGTLTLSGPNTYSGGTIVNGGTLLLGSANAIPSFGSVVVAIGATLDTQGNSDTIGALTVNGTVAGGAGTLAVASLALGDGAAFAPNVVLNGDVTKTGGASVLPGAVDLGGVQRTFNVASSTASELTLNGALSNGGVTKTGNGTLVLGGVNTYTGGTSVNGGTLQIAAQGALPAGTALTLAGGTLSNNNTALSVSSLTGATGTVSLGSGSLAIAQATNTTFSGTITGVGGSVSKSSGGNLTLTTANSFSGGLAVSGGIVIATVAGAAGSGPVTINPNGTFQAGAILSNPITLAGGTLSSQGSPTQVTSGNITVVADSMVLLANATSLATNSEVAVTGTLLGSANITVVPGSNNVSPDGGPGFRLRGTGASNYTGTITVATGAKAEVQTTVAGPFSPAGTGKFIVTGGTFAPGTINGNFSVLNVRNNGAGNTIVGNDVAIAGTGFAFFNVLGTSPAGSVSLMGNLTIGDNQAASPYRQTGNLQVLQFSGVTLTGGSATFAPSPIGFSLTGTANMILGPMIETAPSNVIYAVGSNNTAVAGTLLLNSANNYSGSTTLATGSTGTVFLGAPGALPVTTGLTVNGGTLDFNGGGTSNDQSVVSLAGSGGTITNTEFANTRTLTVNSAAGVNTSFAGAIGGNLSLTKAGNGTLQLTGANTFSGSTLITGGTLSVANSATLGSPVTVNKDAGSGSAVLAGSGTVSTVSVINGTLAPGDSAPGTLTLMGDLDLSAATAHLTLKLGGTDPGASDQLVTSGFISLGGDAQISLLQGGTYTAGDIFYIIVNQGGSLVSGNFSNGPVTDTILDSTGTIKDAAGDRFKVSYTANSAIGGVAGFTPGQGTDVALQLVSAVPEPGSLSMLLSSAGVFTGLRRFRRR